MGPLQRGVGPTWGSHVVTAAGLVHQVFRLDLSKRRRGKKNCANNSKNIQFSTYKVNGWLRGGSVQAKVFRRFVCLVLGHWFGPRRVGSCGWRGAVVSVVPVGVGVWRPGRDLGESTGGSVVVGGSAEGAERGRVGLAEVEAGVANGVT